MRRRSLIPLAVLVALGAGCAADPVTTIPDGVFITVAEPITAGSSVSAELVNHSDAPVSIGWLPCYIVTDRRVGNQWAEIPKQPAACILPEFTVGPGASFPFPFSGPATTGTFRVRTMVEGKTVYSAPFIVR